MPNKIVEILMERDELSEHEARKRLDECRNMIYFEDMDPEEVLMEELGLEPDFILDLI